jgi:hypothetical protein
MMLSLFFLSADAPQSSPQLTEIVFSPQPDDMRVARRGKGLVYSDDQASFQWTKAVKAFAQLAVGTKLAILSDTPFELEGEHGSASASLDFAISKPTDWVAGLFGGKDDSKDYRRLIFKISNSEQKLPGPVKVHLSRSLCEWEQLQIYLDDRKLSNARELLELFTAIGGAPFGAEASSQAAYEPVLSMTVAAGESTLAGKPWYARDNFFSAVHEEITRALSETEVMEVLGVDQAEERLKLVRSPQRFKTLGAVFSQLRKGIPPEHKRYTSAETFPMLMKRKKALRIGCPPMAMSSLLLLRSLASEFSIPLEIFSHHQSSSAILSTIEEHELDYLILSWGAVEKMLASGAGTARALMLLPRTSIDLVVPKDDVYLNKDGLQILVSTDAAGYPYQYFEMIQRSEISPWKQTASADTNLVGIIAQCTKKPCCAIISFPFSGVLTLHFDYRIESPLPASAARFGDNILLRSGLSAATDLDEELTGAIRTIWFRLLEDPEYLERSIKALLGDTQYIKSLRRLGGLYRIAAE